MHRVLGVLIVAVLIAHGVALDAHLRQPQEPAPKTYEEQLAELGRTLDGRFAALEQRVERAEVAQQRHARALQEHLREHTSPAPPVEPEPQPEPPRPVPGPQPPPDVIGWPPIEDVEVWADVRGPPPAQRVRFPARAARWTDEPGFRWSREYAELGGLAVNVWREQWAGWEATRVSVWITNGFAGAGTVHLEGLRVVVAGVALLERAERDVILPRGTLPFRWVLGRGEADVRAWRHISPAGPTMPWMPELALRGLGGMQTKQLGAYRVGDPGVGGGGALDGSHGGWKLAPYWGGRAGWQTTCREGLAWMEQEWLAQVGRCPIATLERGTGRVSNPHAAYWQGRTPDHELPGFTYQAGDGWCAYESQLRYLRAHDHTHYARAFTAAAAVALYDAPARTWLAWCWGDVTLALDGAPSPLNLLQHLPQWFARPAGTGDSRAGRGFAHQLRCFLESEAWLPPDLLVTSWGETWREALRRAVQHVAMPNGVTFAAAQAAWPDAITGVQLVDPIAASRELDLVGANYLGLGLRELDAAWRRFLAPVQTSAGAWQSVGDRLEVRPSARHWSELGNYKPNAQAEYDLFRARDVEGPELTRHGGLDAVLAKARNESPNEPLVANLPTALWQRTLR